MKRQSCPYCGSPTEIRDSSVIYGRSYGLVLICTKYPQCDSFVGLHRSGPQIGQPKGTLANASLRDARKRAHDAFDRLWRGGRMTRCDAYAWLSRATGLQPDRCHIAMMNEAECASVIAAMRQGDA